MQSFMQLLLFVFVHSKSPCSCRGASKQLFQQCEGPTLKAESTGSGLPSRVSYASNCISERRSSPRGEVLPAHSLSALTPVLSAGAAGVESGD